MATGRIIKENYLLCQLLPEIDVTRQLWRTAGFFKYRNIKYRGLFVIVYIGMTKGFKLPKWDLKSDF
jgi:hypothetical protein